MMGGVSVLGYSCVLKVNHPSPEMGAFDSWKLFFRELIQPKFFCV